MILILDGLNCTGKTTMAKQFAYYLGSPETGDLPILKFNVPDGDPHEYFRETLIFQYKKSPHFVIDRCIYSNYAYNSCQGGGVLEPGQFWRLDLMLKQMGAWLFLMVDNPIAIHDRLQQERQRHAYGAESLTRRQIGDIQNRFFEVLNWSHLETKGSFRLPQFVQDGRPTGQFFHLIEKMKEAMRDESGSRREVGR